MGAVDERTDQEKITALEEQVKQLQSDSDAAAVKVETLEGENTDLKSKVAALEAEEAGEDVPKPPPVEGGESDELKAAKQVRDEAVTKLEADRSTVVDDEHTVADADAKVKQLESPAA